MDKTKILTDSTADLPKDFINLLDIDIIPMNLIFDGKTYRDGIDITPETFYKNFDSYQKMHSEPARYEDYALKYKQLTYEHSELLIIHLSSQLSETYDVALKVHEDFKNSHDCKVEIIDSKKCSMGLGLLVLEAAKAAIRGKDLLEIKELTLKNIPNVSIFLSVPELKYLRRGKKIGGMKSLLGRALGVHPVLAINDMGELEVRSKIFGQKENIMLEMIGRIREDIQDNAIDLAITHANAPEMADELRQIFSTRFPCRNIYISDVGPSIGINTGPKSTGIMYLKKGPA